MKTASSQKSIQGTNFASAGSGIALRADVSKRTLWSRVIMTERTYSSPVPQTGRRWPKLWLRAKAQRRTVQFSIPWCKQNREIKGNKFPDKDGSYSIVLMAKRRLQRKKTIISNQGEESLTSDWSFNDRRRRALRCRSRCFLTRSSFGRH
jgi:hypothetical protein